ncbi:MAG: hypothetical protein U9R15_11630 [Chloroflexota bacterium]|nr:hypothetical protein [Chloroflexota bacterium]
MDSNKKILITKISKNGFGKTIGSAFGFGSWTIGGTSIEFTIDPPIDISTKEGQEEYKKLKDTLGKMTLKALMDDVALACKHDKELNMSISQRELHVNRTIEAEEK